MLLFSSIAFLSSIFGGLLFLKLQKINKKFIAIILAFSAGILISVSFLHILPESYAISEAKTAIGFLATVFILFLIENFTFSNSCSEFIEDCHFHKLSIFAFMALGMHSFIDGVNISVAANLKSAAGFNIILALIMHKFADGLTISSIMKNENIENWKIIKSLIIISLLTPIGSISAGYFLQFQGLIPIFMSISAGTFIYISMTEIIPELHKDKNIFMPFILLSGYLFVFIIHIFMEH